MPTVDAGKQLGFPDRAAQRRAANSPKKSGNLMKNLLKGANKSKLYRYGLRGLGGLGVAFTAIELAELLMGGTNRTIDKAGEDTADLGFEMAQRRALRLMENEENRLRALEVHSDFLNNLYKPRGPSRKQIGRAQTDALAQSIIDRHRASAARLAEISKPSEMERLMKARMIYGPNA
jgi:hypothetical protein